MVTLSRVLILSIFAAFATTGATVAQNAPSPTTTVAQNGGGGGGGGGKCGQTPKGCHKNQPQGNKPNKGSSRKCGQTPKGCHKNQPQGNKPNKGGGKPPSHRRSAA
jgi:hypothetical protein